MPMNPRYAKEFQPLFLPWCIGALAALVNMIPISDFPAAETGWLIFLGSVAVMAVMAAQSFGAEFQHWTLPLLLVQPIRRSRSWMEKLLVLGVAVGTLV